MSETLERLGLELTYFLTPSTQGDREQRLVVNVTSEVQVYFIYRDVPLVSIDVLISAARILSPSFTDDPEEHLDVFDGSLPNWEVHARGEGIHSLRGNYPIGIISNLLDGPLDPLTSNLAASLIESKSVSAYDYVRKFYGIEDIYEYDRSRKMIGELNAKFGGALVDNHSSVV